jgi:D-glycero-alpha-D-manno-heptose-7-phosphate kinase
MSRKNSGSSIGEITAHACCRVDLAGGTLDLWPLYLFHENSVTVNFGVNIMTSCRITPRSDRRLCLLSRDTWCDEEYLDIEALRAAKKDKHPLAAHLLKFFTPEGGLTIETHSESPAGAGISGSSALMIATTAALARYTRRKLSPEETRVIAQNVEAQLIGVPTGCQDYYPALYGGVNAIHLSADGIHREAIAVAPEEIEKRFVLVYTGAPRKSGINNWEVFKAHINGDKKVQKNFERIAEIAHGMHQALVAKDWTGVERLLGEEWKQRRTNAPTISTPLIEKLMTVARKNGGRAAKVCGAGGGGCVVFFVEEGSQQRVGEALTQAGGTVLPLEVARKGLQVRVS